MNLPNELWYNIFYFLTQRSQTKFSSLWNLNNLSTEEIQLMWSSNDLWFDTAKNGYIKLMKLLIKAGGININKQDNYGDTVLHKACRYGHKDCLELLIKAGAKLNIQSNFGYAALHCASIHNRKDCVELLIKAGCVDVNIQTNDGCTALVFAIRYDHKEIIELLIKYNTNLNNS